jgi:hypothetical protein
MPITIQIPPDLERALRATTPDLDAAAREAVLVDLYRQRKLNHVQLTDALGGDRFETDAILQRHQVEESSLTIDDVESDRRTVEAFLSREAS